MQRRAFIPGNGAFETAATACIGNSSFTAGDGAGGGSGAGGNFGGRGGHGGLVGCCTNGDRTRGGGGDCVGGGRIMGGGIRG